MSKFTTLRELLTDALSKKPTVNLGPFAADAKSTALVPKPEGALSQVAPSSPPAAPAPAPIMPPMSRRGFLKQSGVRAASGFARSVPQGALNTLLELAKTADQPNAAAKTIYGNKFLPIVVENYEYGGEHPGKHRLIHRVWTGLDEGQGAQGLELYRAPFGRVIVSPWGEYQGSSPWVVKSAVPGQEIHPSDVLHEYLEDLRQNGMFDDEEEGGGWGW